MRATALWMALIAVMSASAARSEVRVVDAADAQLRAMPILIARLDPPGRAARYQIPAHFHLGQVSLIRSVAGGVDASPFVTALPGDMWHGRLRSFGAANGVGFSGTAVRAKSVGFGGLQSEKHVSGFLASELRYGLPMNEDDLLTVDINVVSQRMPVIQTIGYRKSTNVRSVYLGASFAHEHRFSASAGWYALKVSDLSALDYAIERAAGMPAGGQGVRLGLDYRLGQAGAQSGARFGLEWRDGDADRDRRLAIGPGMGRERRMLLRFTEPF